MKRNAADGFFKKPSKINLVSRIEIEVAIFPFFVINLL